jgi:hypothetical protein
MIIREPDSTPLPLPSSDPTVSAVPVEIHPKSAVAGQQQRWRKAGAATATSGGTRIIPNYPQHARPSAAAQDFRSTVPAILCGGNVAFEALTPSQTGEADVLCAANPALQKGRRSENENAQRHRTTSLSR